MADQCKGCGGPIGEAFLTVGTHVYCWRCTLGRLNPTALADEDEGNAQTRYSALKAALKAFGFEVGDFP